MDINRIKEIMQENLETMVRKNRDYSNSSGDNITETGMYGMATRIIDKASRFRTLVDRPKEQINFESVIDTLNDLMNYAAIARALEEGCWQERPSLVYLAGPIDDITTTEASGWRVEVSGALASKGINSFNPHAAYSIANLRPICQQVAEIDRSAIRHCDALIANLLGSGRAFGTIREVEFARSLDKRVIVVAEKLESAFAHDVQVVRTLSEAVEAL